MASDSEKTERPAERGIFDCDEAHHSPRREDYEHLFRNGLVALDTNVLLNLYRSNERTREDTLAALRKLRGRLWIPHQVLTEFWRNRELRSVRHHHGTKAKEACAALDKVERSAGDALDRWTTAVHLKNDSAVMDQIDVALAGLGKTMDALRQLIETQAEKDALPGTGDTHTDPVLTELEPLLQGRIGPPLSPPEYAEAVREAQKRADEEMPPGYEDFRKKPPEQAAGDYVLWLQLLREAARRRCDVLLVTGDVKKDWWTSGDPDVPPRPRTELVVELRQHAGVQLYLLTPGQLLTKAEELLDVQVDKGSVIDLEQLRETEAVTGDSDSGWNVDSINLFLARLSARYPAQTKTILKAVRNGGFVDRATVYSLAGYPEERKLIGFTRPIGTVARELHDEGLLSGEEPFLLQTVYGADTDPSWAAGFRVPDEVIPLLPQPSKEQEPNRTDTSESP